MALQVQDYLLKPVNKQELLANIQRIKIELDQQKIPCPRASISRKWLDALA